MVIFSAAGFNNVWVLSISSALAGSLITLMLLAGSLAGTNLAPTPEHGPNSLHLGHKFIPRHTILEQRWPQDQLRFKGCDPYLRSAKQHLVNYPPLALVTIGCVRRGLAAELPSC